MKLPENYKLIKSKKRLGKVLIHDVLENKISKIPVDILTALKSIEKYDVDKKLLSEHEIPNEIHVETCFTNVDSDDCSYRLTYTDSSGAARCTWDEIFCKTIDDVINIVTNHLKTENEINILNSGLELKD